MNSAVRNIRIARDMSSGDFRGAMRHLAGGVSVITAGRGKDIAGMTVTSVSSLSVDPPTLIVSINRGSSSWPILKRLGVFGVNILTADQLDIAERFTGKDGLKGADRFTGAEWMTRVSGVPLLVGALAAVDCEVEEIVERHSHAIVIGRVLDMQSRRAPRRWPTGRGNMSRSIRTRMWSSWLRSAFRLGAFGARLDLAISKRRPRGPVWPACRLPVACHVGATRFGLNSIGRASRFSGSGWSPSIALTTTSRAFPTSSACCMIRSLHSDTIWSASCIILSCL